MGFYENIVQGTWEHCARDIRVVFFVSCVKFRINRGIDVTRSSQLKKFKSEEEEEDDDVEEEEEANDEEEDDDEEDDDEEEE